MSVVDKLTEPVKRWLVTKALKKAVVQLGTLVASWVAANGLASYGISMTPEQAAAGIFTLLSILRNWLKTSWPERFGWL